MVNCLSLKLKRCSLKKSQNVTRCRIQFNIQANNFLATNTQARNRKTFGIAEKSQNPCFSRRVHQQRHPTKEFLAQSSQTLLNEMHFPSSCINKNKKLHNVGLLGNIKGVSKETPKRTLGM